MATVDPVDSIVYGFQLLGYLLGVLVVGFAVIVLGSEMFGALNPLLGQLVSLLGIGVVLAGLLGMQHKVIADSVTKGRTDGETEKSSSLPDELSVLRVQRSTDDENGEAPVKTENSESTAKKS